MNKLKVLILSGVSAIVLSGCGGSGGSSTYSTYFITDSYGDGVEGIVYSCDSGIQGVTDIDGAFDFDATGDTCDFDFVSYNINDLYLESDNDPFTDAGVSDIYFECVTNGFTESSGYTDFYGYIDDGSLYDGCTLFDIH